MRGPGHVLGRDRRCDLRASARSSALERPGRRRRSAAAKLGWIAIARGLVLEDRRTVRVHTNAWVHTFRNGTSDDMSRFGVMHLCGVGRSAEGNQNAQGQDRTHRICSDRTRFRVMRGPRRRNLSRLQDRSNPGDRATCGSPPGSAEFTRPRASGKNIGGGDDFAVMAERGNAAIAVREGILFAADAARQQVDCRYKRIRSSNRNS